MRRGWFYLHVPVAQRRGRRSPRAFASSLQQEIAEMTSRHKFHQKSVI
jgi:hypothetical protein